MIDALRRGRAGNHRTSHRHCLQHLVLDPARDPQRLQRTCEALKATFIAGTGCPTAELVGTCVRSRGDALESTYRYYTRFPGSGVTFTRDKVAAEGQRQCMPPKGEWALN